MYQFWIDITTSSIFRVLTGLPTSFPYSNQRFLVLFHIKVALHPTRKLVASTILNWPKGRFSWWYATGDGRPLAWVLHWRERGEDSLGRHGATRTWHNLLELALRRGKKWPASGSEHGLYLERTCYSLSLPSRFSWRNHQLQRSLLSAK